MRPVLSFTPAPLPGEIVKMGEELIGEVKPALGGACFVVWLPGERAAFQPAKDLRQARRRLVDVVERWLVRVGIFYPGESVAVRAPADPDLCSETKRA